MKRVLLLFITAVVPACYGTYSLPFLGTLWRPGYKDPYPRERIEIDMRSAPRRVNESSVLQAFVPEKDTLDVQLLWKASNPEVLNVDLWTGLAVAKKPGKARLCAAVAYFYLPLSDDASRVDRQNRSGPKLMVRNGSSKETCTGVLSIAP